MDKTEMKVNALRAQLNDIVQQKSNKADIESQGINLFNNNDKNIIESSYVNNLGVIVTGDTRYFLTGYIPVSSGEQYSFPLLPNILSNMCVGYYDASYKWISNSIATDNSTVRTITVPTNSDIKYMRVNGRNNSNPNFYRDTFMIVKGGSTVYPAQYVPYVKKILYSRWIDKKVNFIGDSITAGVNTTTRYYQYLQANMRLNTARGYGSSGSTISDHLAPMHSRVLSMSTDVDLICVFGGTNDFKNSIPLGDLFTVTNGVRSINIDTTTFYGALHQLCQNIINTFTGKQCVLITPLQRESYSGQFTSLQSNALGLYMDDYVNAIKEVGRYYAIPVLDLYATSGLQPNVPSIKSKYFGTDDGLHPNSAGHDLIATKLEAFLNTI